MGGRSGVVLLHERRTPAEGKKTPRTGKNQAKTNFFRFFLKIIVFLFGRLKKTPYLCTQKTKPSINRPAQGHKTKKKMNTKNIAAALVAIATANAQGFTVDAQTLQPVTTGYAVALAETQNSFGAEGLARVIEFVNNTPGVNAFGGWLDSETGLFYWDATVIVSDRATAEELARKNGQLAFFDLANLEEIRVK